MSKEQTCKSELYLLLHKDMPNTEWHYKNKTNQSTTFFVSVEKNNFEGLYLQLSGFQLQQITKKHPKKWSTTLQFPSLLKPHKMFE